MDIAESAVRRVVGVVLKLPQDRIDRAAPLGSLGLDSLMSIELRNRLQRELGMKLSATVAWNHPSVRELAAYALTVLAGTASSEPAVVASHAAGESSVEVLASGVSELSDEQALAALMCGGGR
jgi:acyl carrier protein